MTTFLRMQLTVIGERIRKRGKFEILWIFFYSLGKVVLFRFVSPSRHIGWAVWTFSLRERARKCRPITTVRLLGSSSVFVSYIWGLCEGGVGDDNKPTGEKRERTRERERGTPGNGKFKLNKKREKWKCGSDEISLCLSFCDENVNWQATGSW